MSGLKREMRTGKIVRNTSLASGVPEGQSGEDDPVWMEQRRALPRTSGNWMNPVPTMFAGHTRMIILEDLMRRVAIVLLAILLPGAGISPGESGQPVTVQTGLASPAYFIANTAHQKTGKRLVPDGEVFAFLQTGAGRVLFTPAGACIGIPVPVDRETAPDAGLPARPGRRPGGETHPVRMAVLGAGFGAAVRQKAAGGIRMELREEMEGKVNFLIGPSSEWRTSLPVYRKLVYRDVRDGIDVEYTGRGGGLEYRLTVRPGTGLDRLRMETGAESLTLDLQGGLTAGLEDAALRLAPPVAWQETEQGRKQIPVAYQTFDAGQYGYRVEEADPAKTLFLSASLSWCTYLGPSGMAGTGQDNGRAIAIGPDGCAYVAGYTESADFPATPGAFLTGFKGYSDAFAVKLKADGTGAVYSTFLGGDFSDYAYSIAVEAGGQAVIAGSTESGNFPVTSGAYDSGYSGADCFVSKLNPSGSALVYSARIGGPGYDFARGAALDAGGNVYVTGNAGSSTFPCTAGAFDTTSNGGFDGFVFKLNAAGSSLLYCTFLGGGGNDYGYSIAADAAGCAYVAGKTESSGFPVTAGAYDTTHNGSFDGFAAKLNAAGSALLYSTFLGGGNEDEAISLALGSDGRVTVAGTACSANFPATPGAYDTAFTDSPDGFITRLNAAGSSLEYSTRLGTASTDYCYGVAVDGTGHAYVTGYSRSASFPVTPGAWQDNAIGRNAFVTKLNPAGSALVYSTDLGGSSTDYGYGIAVDTAGQAHVTGDTVSADFPVTAGAWDAGHNGMQDAFATKLNAAGSALVYSTYLGGRSHGDWGGKTGADAAGNVYVAGITNSYDYPVTPGAWDTAHDGVTNAMITKLNPAGSALVYSTYLGGNGYETLQGMAVDAAGQVLVTGDTNSSDFPVTPGAWDTTALSGYDAYVTKLNAGGTGLVFSTFLGGSEYDSGYALSIDAGGQVTVAGVTYSDNFPVTPGAYSTSKRGDTDTFAARFNSTGTALLFSTYLGGTGYDRVWDLALDQTGNVYLVGETESADFPVTPGAIDTSFGGGSDVFVTRLNPDGRTLGYSTYLGGNGWDYGFGIAVNGTGCAFVTGQAKAGFPATAGSPFPEPLGGDDVFVSQLNPGGSALVYSTYLGDSAQEAGHDITLDSGGNAYVCGYTSSKFFPVSPDALAKDKKFGFDAFVAKLNPAGTALTYSTYLGGNGEDKATGLALDPAGNLFVTGTTHSSDFPVTAGAYDTQNPAGPDVFVTKLIFQQQNFTIGGNLGVGTAFPARAVHVAGPNAVFRMDRPSDSAAFMLARTNAGFSQIWKAFVVGVNASAPGTGEFIINDLGATAGGTGSRRFTFGNTGNAVFTGPVTARAYHTASSLRFKTGITPLEGMMTRLRQLRAYRFQWKATGAPDIGFLAEEAAPLFPAAVQRSETGLIQALDYRKLAVALVEACQARQRKIELLRRERDELRQLLERLESLSRGKAGR